MVGKNNIKVMQEKQGEHYRKWSIKRLSIGVVSVSVAAGIFISSNLLLSTTVLADENTSVENVVVDEKNETKQADEIKQTATDTAESTPEEVADVPEKVVATEASEKDITQEKALDKTPVKDDTAQKLSESKEDFARVTTASIDISEPKASAVNESTPLDNTPKTTNTPIDIDAIESGKVTTGGQLTNANQVVSGWVELAPTSWVGYTPGTGGATKLDGYTVYLQWIDTDGAMSPLYSTKTHDLAGAASNGGGQGTFAFDLPTFTDANGVEHKFTFIPTSSQRLKMWLAPGQISADGNELITFRPVVGNTPGFSTPTTAGAFYLAGANLQRASIYVAELPSTDTLNKLVGDQKNWRYDDAGPDSNPGLVGQDTNRVSGSVWWETSKNGTTFPTSTGENFVDQTADEAKTGFRVVTAALTPEGIAALKSTQDADNVNDKVKEQLAILAAHPEYIQEVVVAPVIDGKYTAHFTDDIDTDGLYQFILNPKGEVQTAYSNYPVPAYGHPRQYTHSNPYVVGQQVYNSHFALVPNLENYNIEITNFDTTTKTALPGDKAVSDVNAVFSAGQVTEIVWQAAGKEISRTEVTNLAEAKKAAEFTVPADMDTDTIYMVELVVNGVTVDADSFLAKMPTDADKYTATGGKLEKGFGETTTEAEVVGKVTTDYPKDGQTQPTIKVKPGTKLPDGTKSGEYKVPVVVTYPDGSTDETEVAVTVLDKVIDQTADPSQPTPKGYVRVTFAAGTNGSFAQGVSTVFDVKAGTALTELTLPKVTANKGYAQKAGTEAWGPALPTTITAAGTYTAQYVATQSDADKYTATGDKLEKGFGEATTEAEVVGKVTTDYPKDGQAQPTIKVKPGTKLPDGTKPGKYTIPVEVTYPDGSTDATEVGVTVLDKVIDQTADPSQPTPKGYVRVIFAAGINGSFAQGVSTVFDVKAGTALTELTLPKVTANKGYVQKAGAEAWSPALPTTITAAGTYTAQYKVAQNDAEKYTATGDKLEKGFGEATTEAEVIGKVTTDYPADAVKQPTYKATPYGGSLPDGTKPGKYTIPVEVTYPDGTIDKVNVIVTVLDKVIDQTADPSQPTPKGYVRVTFVAGTNGSFAEDTSTVFDVKAGTALTELTLPKVTANKGYTQKAGAEAWGPVLPTTITAAGTYTAQYVTTQSDADKYTATGDKLEKGFGEATTEADVFAKVTTDYPADAAKQPTYKAKPYGGSLPDGTKSGKYTIPVEVTYPDGTIDKVNVIVTVLDKVIDQTADPSQPTPKGYVRVTFVAGTNGSFAKGTSTVFDVKAGTALTELTLPKVTANKGYAQKAGTEAWGPMLPTTITAAGTYTAQYVTTQSDAEKYTATGDKLEKSFGEATTEAEVFAKVTTDYPADAAKQPTYKAKPYGGKLPDGTKPGKYTIPVEVTYPDGTMDKVNVIVTVLDKVIDQTADPSQPTPKGYVRVTFAAGTNGSFAKGTSTVFDVKAGTALTELTLPKVTANKGYTQKAGAEAWGPALPTTITAAGTYTAQYEVLKTDADKNVPLPEDLQTPKGELPPAKDGIKNKDELPKDTEYSWKEQPDTTTPGDKTGTVVVTYPDGSSEEVTVKVHVTSDAEENDPKGQDVTTEQGKLPDPSEGIKNKDDLPEGTKYHWKDELDVTTPGDKTGVVVVTYPDGSSEEVTVTVHIEAKKVVDMSENAVTPTVPQKTQATATLKKELPQLGDKAERKVGVLGVFLIAVASVFGFTTFKKRKED